jgi:hypothetical protein
MTIKFGATTSASTYVTLQSASRRRALLQLGSMSTQVSTSVDISGGSISGVALSGSFESSAMYISGGRIDGTPIGATNPSSGDFTALKATSFASSNVNITGGSITGVALSGSTFSSTAVAISGGYIAGTPIGATNASSGNFTALDASSNFTGVHIALSSGLNATTGTFSGGITASSGAFTNGISASSADIATITLTSNISAVHIGLTSGINATTATFTGGMTASSAAITNGITASSGGFTNGITASSATFTNGVAVGYVANAAPVTKTADFTLAATENWVIINTTIACTVTLPAASAFTGRDVTFQNYSSYALATTASNVVPLGGGSAGTAILSSVGGNWATLVSDGTNWVIMRSAPNNILLLS